MADPFRAQRQNDVTAQPGSWKAFTPADDITDLPMVPKALWVDTAGNIKLSGADGNAEVFAVQAGLVPLAPTRIWQTGTTVTGIKLLFG